MLAVPTFLFNPRRTAAGRARNDERPAGVSLPRGGVQVQAAAPQPPLVLRGGGPYQEQKRPERPVTVTAVADILAR